MDRLEPDRLQERTGPIGLTGIGRPDRSETDQTGPDQSDIRGAEASHHGSWIMDLVLA